MSRRTSSRSTLTMTPSTMSPSLKYLIVSSTAARKASSEPRSSMAMAGLGPPESVVAGISEGTPMWADVEGCHDGTLKKSPSPGAQGDVTYRRAEDRRIFQHGPLRLGTCRPGAPSKDTYAWEAGSTAGAFRCRAIRRILHCLRLNEER